MVLELTDSVELARVEEKISKNISKYFYILIPNWIKMAAF